MGWQASGSDPLSHVVQHPLRTLHLEDGPFESITVLSDQIVMMLVAGFVLCVFLPLLLKKRRDKSEIGQLVPTGVARFVELVCEYFRKEVAEPILGEHAGRFIKYIWSVFFFLLTINLLGLIPISSISALFHVHLGGTATANIWVTATLAILTLILMVVSGLRFGGKAYLAHFAPGPLWLAPLMVVLEIVGLFAKGFALAVRLFANMLAGHILLAVLVSMILSAGEALGMVGGFAIAVPVVLGAVAISFLEIFVAFLQAFIFTYLTTVFIGMSVNVHHEDHHEAAAH